MTSPVDVLDNFVDNLFTRIANFWKPIQGTDRTIVFFTLLFLTAFFLLALFKPEIFRTPDGQPDETFSEYNRH